MTSHLSSKIKLAACIAWAGAFGSIATPANALAATYQIGAYASCSADWASYYDDGSLCPGRQFSYTQTIRLIQTACSSGDCENATSNVYTDQVYPVGRKPATKIGECSIALKLYAMGSCGC